LTGVRQGETESLGRFGVGMVERSVRNGATTGARSILTSQSVPRRRDEGMECLDPRSEGCRACAVSIISSVNRLGEGLSSLFVFAQSPSEEEDSLTIRESRLTVRVRLQVAI